jgi:flagellar biosynthesis anti-sigma factor FlgM
MKIDGFQNIPAILQSYPKTTSSISKSEIETPSSSVSLSSFAEVLQSLQRQSAQIAQSRVGKVDQLAQQAQTGNYQVDVNKLAAKIVESNIVDFKG